MSGKNGGTAIESREELPRPRLGWLAAFHVLVIALVLFMAHETRGLAEGPLLEDQLGAQAETPFGETSSARPWGGRGWLAALTAMLGALLLMLPIAWAYVATRSRRKVDQSVVTTIVLLPIAVAAILVIVQDSLAVAFSLAGIAGLVRFRNALDDTKDAMYVFVAIAVGLGAGVGTLEASAALSGLYNLVVVALWKWHTSQPVIADIALGEHTVPKGRTVLETLMPKHDPERHPAPVAEWFEPGMTMPLGGGREAVASGAPDKREGILRVHAADDIATRRSIDDVLQAHAKRWTLESDDPGPDALPTLTYQVRLKKRSEPGALLDALRQRLAPELAEYAPVAEPAPAPDVGAPVPAP
ncbi:MAG TPA: DUF4956 domain-containing protein [Gemmatimonadales bacterium]